MGGPAADYKNSCQNLDHASHNYAAFLMLTTITSPSVYCVGNGIKDTQKKDTCTSRSKKKGVVINLI